jgi:hypothetical protein
MFWDMVKSVIRNVARAGESPRGRAALIVAFVLGLLLDIGVFVVQRNLPDAATVVTLVVIFLSPAIFVLIGFDHARSDDPIRILFERPNAGKAPYLLACAATLQQRPDFSVRDKREAIEELGEELRNLKDENDYIGAVVSDIRKSSVGAVCGRKTKQNAPNFFEANKESYRAHNYIERAFFPPTTTEEAKSIRSAIQDHHFPIGMLVRALWPEQDPEDVRHTLILPPGFGMTIMGERTRPGNNDECDPKSKYGVLIHWGGVGTGTHHHGVILKKNAWLEYFWDDVFTKVRGVTRIANPGGTKREWNNFISEYPAYDEIASRRAN